MSAADGDALDTERESQINHDTQCGTCGRTWSSISMPTPGARCPYEYEHARPTHIRVRAWIEYDFAIGDSPVETEAEAIKDVRSMIDNDQVPPSEFTIEVVS